MTTANEKPIKYNGEFLRLTSGGKKIVNLEKAQRCADREAKRMERSLVTPTGYVQDDGEHYTITVKGGIRG